MTSKDVKIKIQELGRTCRVVNTKYGKHYIPIVKLDPNRFTASSREELIRDIEDLISQPSSFPSHESKELAKLRLAELIPY